ELPVWPNFGYALWYQVKHNLVGHQTYLIGCESTKSLWFYYPVLLTIKTPAALLLLLALALLAPGPRLNLALGLAGLLFLYSVTIKVQLGVRLVLPLVCFLIVGLAVRVVAGLAALPARRRWAGAVVLAGALLWLGVGTARLWPDGLRYTS